MVLGFGGASASCCSGVRAQKASWALLRMAHCCRRCPLPVVPAPSCWLPVAAGCGHTESGSAWPGRCHIHSEFLDEVTSKAKHHGEGGEIRQHLCEGRRGRLCQLAASARRITFVLRVDTGSSAQCIGSPACIAVSASPCSCLIHIQGHKGHLAHVQCLHQVEQRKL